MRDKTSTHAGRLGRGVLLQLTAGAILATAAASQAAPPPQVTGNVPINAPQQLFPHDNPSRNTSSLAASPDGQHLLAGFEDLQGLCGTPGGLQCPPESVPGYTSYSFSTDGGASWTDAGSPFPVGPLETAGHPWVARLSRSGDIEAADGKDHGIYFLTTRMQQTASAVSTGIAVYRGHFGASTFVFDNATTLNSPNAPGDQFTRQAIAAARDGSASAYIVVVNVDEICGVPLAGFGQIEVVSTHDGGNAWSPRVIVAPEGADITDPNNPNCGATGHLQVAPAIAIGPKGEVYVVYQSGPQFAADGSNGPTDHIGFSRSLDGGKTFSTPKLITNQNAMRDDPPVGYAKNRMNDQPRIAVATGGPHRGRVFVTYYAAVSPVTGSPAKQEPVSSQAYLVWSDDRGNTWSAPQPLAGPVPATGLKRIWPTVSVRPSGDVDVVYLESQEVATGTTCSVPFNPTSRRTGPLNSLVDTFWVQSRDGGASFSSPLRVSTATSNWCTAPYQFDVPQVHDSFLISNAGDYIDSISVGNRTLSLWPDDRNGPMDTFFTTVKGAAPGPHHRSGTADEE
jgi:hypothetical protein